MICRIVNLWSASGKQRFTVPSLRTVKPMLDSDIEDSVHFLTTETINFLNTRNSKERSLSLDLPSINSGGRGGSLFSAAELWDRIYFFMERKNDRSANTVSIRWIDLNAPKFETLLEDSIRLMLKNDVFMLRERAITRSDFLRSINTRNN